MFFNGNETTLGGLVVDGRLVFRSHLVSIGRVDPKNAFTAATGALSQRPLSHRSGLPFSGNSFKIEIIRELGNK